MRTLIKNATIYNNGISFIGNIVINNEIIESVGHNAGAPHNNFDQVIDATGKIAIPGVIDDQVHFREPGLTHKADIFSESRAAIAGGVTSFMDMPNTNPQTTSATELNKKFDIAAQKSLANYSFYLGATNNNINDVKNANPKKVCGIKVFMGSSTGNMLVDDDKTLAAIFAESPCLIATHCEDEKTIKQNLEKISAQYNTLLPQHHPIVRSAEACYKSSAKAVELADKYNSKLHILHLSTAREMSLLNAGPVNSKKITGEVCVHHLWFDQADYKNLGYYIKWNPAIKTLNDKLALQNALIANKLDVVATDHAPHLLSEKLNQYENSASGGPMVQHSLIAMLELYHKKVFTIDTIVNKMCHAPAQLFNIDRRGYLNPGFYADIAIVDLNAPWLVNPDNILYKCKWSPFNNVTFNSKVTHTFVNGQLVYNNGSFTGLANSKPLQFNR